MNFVMFVELLGLFNIMAIMMKMEIYWLFLILVEGIMMEATMPMDIMIMETALRTVTVVDVENAVNVEIAAWLSFSFLSDFYSSYFFV